MGKSPNEKINPFSRKVMMFLKRDFDVQHAVIEILNWADSIIVYTLFTNATEGDPTEYSDVEGAGLRRTTNISICNVLPRILKPMNV